jgi:hypothetical protein
MALNFIMQRLNKVRNSSGNVVSNMGHAVYVDSSPVKRRETTAGPSVNMNSAVAGTAGGGRIEGGAYSGKPWCQNHRSSLNK